MRRMVAAWAIAALLLLGPAARAGSLGELGAATAIHDALAGTGVRSGARALGSARDAIHRNVPRPGASGNVLGGGSRRGAGQGCWASPRSQAMTSAPGRGWATAKASSLGGGRTGGGWASRHTGAGSGGRSGWATSGSARQDSAALPR
jgi:hypothetical protein